MAQTASRTEPPAQPILTETTLSMTRRLPAPRADVFRMWTEPEHIRHWFCPVGFTVVTSEVDLRPGGQYVIAMRAPDGKVHTTKGAYREIVAPERLVYTWQWTGPGSAETLVTVEFKDLGSETELVLRHERFTGAAHRDSHLAGWNGCLSNLDRYVPTVVRR
jgi:uncharacterized protein YndB with AHSA1/START domain